MKIDNNIAISDFLVYIIELASAEIFNNDNALSYQTLFENGIIDYYKETYDVSHTLGKEYLLNEIIELLNRKTK